MKPRFSLVVIAKNEEALLANCLQSVASLVDEIVVVDTGSADRTREVAASFGARVWNFPWAEDFAAARNETLRHATGNWILYLDADESLDEANRQKLLALKARLDNEPAAYVLNQRSFQAGSASATRVPQVRLFRKHPAICWEYRVHEQVLPSLRQAGFPVHWTDIVIHHTGYQDPALQVQKLERDLRLLLRDQADRPDDPYVLFNLGLAYRGFGRHGEALEFFRSSLDHCLPDDTIVPKVYAALVQGHTLVGQPREALAACRAGLARFPEDPELLFLDGSLHRAMRDLGRAEASWRQLLSRNPLAPPPNLVFPLGAETNNETIGVTLGRSLEVDEGLLGFARHQLALLYRDQGRAAESEGLWRTALAEQPDLAAAWLGLGELYLAQGRWPELEQVLSHLARLPGGQAETDLLRGRACLARKEFGQARALLEGVIAREPQRVPARVILTHVLLQKGRDPAAAEQALRALLTLDPGQAESWRNLAVLLNSLGRRDDALAACQSAQDIGAADPELLFLHGLLLREAGDLARAEACLVGLLERETAPGLPEPQARVSRERRVRARHHLALLYRDQRRLPEAESQWRAVLAELPDLPAAWQGLAELYLMEGRLSEGEAILARLEASSAGAWAAGLLRARFHLERREFLAARKLLEGLISQEPRAPEPGRLLSYALLQEGTADVAAAQALRDLLGLVPGDAEARHNLAILLNKQGRQPPPNP